MVNMHKHTLTLTHTHTHTNNLAVNLGHLLGNIVPNFLRLRKTFLNLRFYSPKTRGQMFYDLALGQHVP